MPRPMSIRRNVALAIVASSALAACRSGAPDPLPGCPHCGDPVTVATPGGNRVVARMRLPAPDVDPVGAALRWPPFADGH